MSESALAEKLVDVSARTPRRQGAAARSRLPSVRLLITIIVVMPITVVAVALIAIATLTAGGIAEQLGDEIVDSATERVVADIRHYLSAATSVSDLYTRRIRDGTLPVNGLRSWQHTMFQDLMTHPNVASICFTTPNADCTWLLRAHDRLELGIVDGDNREHAIELEVRPDGTVDRENVLRDYLFDATQRPWYGIAMRNSEPIWTPIYSWFGQTGPASTTGTGYASVVRAGDGAVMGVLIIDVTLGAISEHLQGLQAERHGWVFVTDETGMLVAASEGAVNSNEGKRLSPADSDSAAARAISGLVSVAVHGPDVKAPLKDRRRVFVAGQPVLAQVTEIHPYPGIHWHVVTMLPESSFLSGAASLRNRAMLLALGSIIGSLALGLILSRNLSRPLLQLSGHVARVGQGDFDSRLNLGHASELRRLSDEVNEMASGLKHRMQMEHSLAVATQVQQALLPSTRPTLPGLEIAWCSRYCESTGGDYYDFIEIPGLEAHRTLVAVGDVTGHGIGAAMFMSVARGALRASCDGAPSLGHILSRTNSVLAGSAHQGMFMTLALLFVNPESGYALWATAGHDPAIVYHPDSDSFEELQSGDMPLGIEPDVVYREFSRPCAAPASVFVVGTDGIWEARNADGEMFGKERLRELIRTHHDNAEKLTDAIQRAMWSWIGPRSLQDDVTFVILRVRE